MLFSRITNDSLPQGWSRCCLPDFTDIVMGQSPTSDTYNRGGDGIPFFQGKAEFGAIYPTVAKYCNAPNKIALPGATLLSVRAPVGPTNLAKEKCCIGRGLAAIHPVGGISPMFVLYLLRGIETDISKEGTGSTFSAINKQFVEELEFGLPPLPEQHRIVAKIEELFSELDKGIENLKTAHAQLKVYRQALLKHAFEGKLTAQWRAENQDKLESAEALLKRIQTERAQHYQQQLTDWETFGKQGRKPKTPKTLPPLTTEELAELPELPDGWGWEKLGNIADLIGGVTKGKNLEGKEKLSLPYLRVANVQDGYLDLTEIKQIEVETQDKDKYRLEFGDVLYTEGGDKDKLGRGAVWRNQIDSCIHQNHIFRARIYGGVISSEILSLYSQTKSAKKYFFRHAKQTTNLASINLTVLANLPVAIFSQREQQQILLETESRLSECDQLDQTITTALQQAEALRQSILKKAFSGQLVPQDPHDEPASALLARIKAEKATVAKNGTVTAKSRKLTGRKA
ncbi:MAG: restriction endonuclease subunit S [Candidatus Aquicultor sp.]|nr:restriction endonuclease subunit S [Candidatus Aquicultor sp.]